MSAAVVIKGSLYLCIDQLVNPVNLRYLRHNVRDMIAVWKDSRTHILVTPLSYFYFREGEFNGDHIREKFFACEPKTFYKFLTCESKTVHEHLKYNINMTFETFVNHHIDDQKPLDDQVVDTQGDFTTNLPKIKVYLVSKRIYKHFNNDKFETPETFKFQTRKDRFQFLTTDERISQNLDMFALLEEDDNKAAEAEAAAAAAAFKEASTSSSSKVSSSSSIGGVKKRQIVKKTIRKPINKRQKKIKHHLLKFL